MSRWRGVRRGTSACSAGTALPLDAQVVVLLGDDGRDELSWNAADVAASRTEEEDLRAALLAELAHRGVGEDHGETALHQLAAVLLEASGPTPATPSATPSATASSWTITPWGRDEGADHDVLRAVLHALRPWADQVQTDLPLALREHWPSDVAAACDHLLAASPRHRGDDDGCATTGWLPARDDATWSAFVTLAPHALSADVLSGGARVVVDLSDQGTALALRLDGAQRAAVMTALDGGRGLRPLGRPGGRARTGALDPAEVVFVVAGDGVEHHATAREAAAHMEAIDVEDGEYAGVFGLDGTVYDVVVRRGLVELDRTDRRDLSALHDALRDALGLPPGTPVDAVAVVNHRQRRMWERRWPRWPRRLDRRLHGAAPALLPARGVTEPGSE